MAIPHRATRAGTRNEKEKKKELVNKQDPSKKCIV